MSSNEPAPPRPEAGWYELPGEPDVERYWDGVTWSHNVRIKKSILKKENFFLFLYPHLIKWYSLVAVLIVGTLIVGIFSIQNKPISQAAIDTKPNFSSIDTKQNVMSACSEILNFDWYKINTQVFAHSPDVAARKSNVIFLDSFLEKSNNNQFDSEFVKLVTAVSRELDSVLNTQYLSEAVVAAASADVQFKSLTDYCNSAGAAGASPIISEATENNSKPDAVNQARIPDGYDDFGNGLAFKLSPAQNCPQVQFGCTKIEIFSYRECPGGVHIYVDFSNLEGGPVAVADYQTGPLQNGQSTAVNAGTALSTAVSAEPNNFVCK
jgi:hypothetical protein